MERISDLERLGSMQLRNYHIPEGEVGYYFSAADAVACLFEESHVVSSGTFTRGVVAGCRIVTYDHGVVAQLTRQLDLGIVIRRKDVRWSSVAIKISECLSSSVYDQGDAARRWAKATESAVYEETICRRVQQLLIKPDVI
jgi:hypothetical protein